MPFSLVTLKNGEGSWFLPPSCLESTSSTGNKSWKVFNTQRIYLQITSCWKKSGIGWYNICLLAKTYCTNTARRVDAVVLYWLESLAYGFPPLRFKGIPISHLQSIRKGIWPVFFNLYKSTQSISLGWNVMDVSVIVGPGRENEASASTIHHLCFFRYTRFLIFYLTSSDALTTSEKAFEAVAFKRRNIWVKINKWK